MNRDRNGTPLCTAVTGLLVHFVRCQIEEGASDLAHSNTLKVPVLATCHGLIMTCCIGSGNG